MHCSIILLAYHGDDWIPNCIASLASASLQTQHLVLVDNSGNSVLEEQDYSKFDLECLQTPLPMGFAEGNNYALVHSDRLSDVIVFLNQDTVGEPGWLDNLLFAFESREFNILSPVIKDYELAEWDASFLYCLGDKDPQRLDPVQVVDLLPAPALAIRKSTLADTGPFDPVYGSYYEDYDLCRRSNCRLAFVQSAVIGHFSGSVTNTEQKIKERQRKILRNRFIYEMRWEGTNRLLHAVKQLFVEFPHRIARSVAGTSSSQGLKEVFGAQLDIFMLYRRLLSTKRDLAEWEKYLRSIDWKLT